MVQKSAIRCQSKQIAKLKAYPVSGREEQSEVLNNLYISWRVHCILARIMVWSSYSFSVRIQGERPKSVAASIFQFLN